MAPLYDYPRPAMPSGSRLYAWTIDATAGHDSAWVRLGHAGIQASGRIAALLPEPHWVAYELEVDADLITRRLQVQVRRASGVASLDLRHEGEAWSVDEGPRPDLDGAIDVDLAGCPLTNVMPIRRLQLVTTAGSANLLMAFVELPDLRVVADRQRYTHVRTLPDGGAIVRYESGDFRSDLTVDRDGAVVDYPRLGRRITASSTELGPSGSAR